MPFKTPLEAAIAHLIAQGRIKSSSDVARDMNLKSRGTVSSYVTGSAKISPNFQTLFENTYNIRLKDFEGNKGGGLTSNMNGENKNHLERAIENLTEADLINARNIERLINLLEHKLSFGMELPEPGQPGTIPIEREKKKSQ